MMNAANQGIELLSSAQMEARGKIKVSLPTALSRSFINDKIAKFAIKYPEIALNVDYSDTQNNIIGEKVDLTIRAGELEDSDFISKKLGVLKRQLVCTSPFYLKHPHPVFPQNVSTWQWIKLTQLSNQRLFSKSGQRQAVRFNNQISVNSVEAIYQYCLNGVGLATLSSSQVSEDILTGRLVHVLPDWEITPLPLFALWPKNTKPKSIVKLFLSYLVQ
ncbi:MAG: substrate binding domain-containing protein [Pseudomonadota bacterium]